MPWNVLILPLMGGFIFINWFYYTRFTVRRAGRYRLLFYAAISAVFLLVAARCVTYVAAPLVSPALSLGLRQFAPFAFIGTSFLAFLLGFLAFPINSCLTKQVAERKAIEKSGDRLEVLLDRALVEVKYVSITLANSKVYIGLVTDSPDPIRDRDYIKIVPLHSGYRREEDKTIVFTTDYSEVLAQVDRHEEIQLDLEDFELVIPVSKMQTVSLFSWDAYELFNPSPSADAENQLNLFPSSSK